MAEESESGQEKTEEPSGRRLEQAREEGQIARSRELNTSAVLIAGSGALIMFGPSLAQRFLNIMKDCFGFDRATGFSEGLMFAHLARSFQEGFWGTLPILAILVLVAVLAPTLMGGWNFSVKALTPKASVLNPLKGLKRMFSTTALVELLKGIGKVSVLGFGAWYMLDSLTDSLLAMRYQELSTAIRDATEDIGWTAFYLALSTLLIVIIDVPYQLWDHSKKLKMTLQEVKDEMKDSEGKPEVKGRIRQLQREMAYRRMMEAVPEADVVITNPTHFSVALKYDPSQPGAPKVVARGVDFAALKIREIAKANDVVMFEAPPLARAIYFTTEVGREIPEGLYLAVAQVLAYVFQLRAYRPGKGKRPTPPRRFEIPEDLTYDENGQGKNSADGTAGAPYA